jgi:phage terminase large subunit GpA-like protein
VANLRSALWCRDDLEDCEIPALLLAILSMPIRYLFADEIDEYPGDVDGQGDPISLAEKRLAGPTWSRRKELLVSTPTIKGLSAIEREFLKSDQRRYFVPCPECGHYDWIRWENIRWTPEEPETAALVCVECGVRIEERHKRTMLPAGEWRATAEGDGETIGFHISSLYSPLGWFPWSAAVEEFLAAKGEPMKLKTWVNTVLGETWEERRDSVDATALLERRESYSAEVPEGVRILVGFRIGGEGKRIVMITVKSKVPAKGGRW